MFFGLINVFLVLLILPTNLRDNDFRRTIKESLPTMLLVAVMVNVTGTILKGISNIAGVRREIYTVYPAIIDMMGDVGLVVGSAASTKLALGVLSPSFSSIKNHFKNILSAWVPTVLLFVVLGLVSCAINGLFTIAAISNLLVLLLISQAAEQVHRRGFPRARGSHDGDVLPPVNRK